jgi:hypothetical protein
MNQGDIPEWSHGSANMTILYMMEREGILGIEAKFTLQLDPMALEDIQNKLRSHGIAINSLTQPSVNSIKFELMYPKAVFASKEKYSIFACACAAIARILDDTPPTFFQIKKFVGDLGVTQLYQTAKQEAHHAG